MTDTRDEGRTRFELDEGFFLEVLREMRHDDPDAGLFAPTSDEGLASVLATAVQDHIDACLCAPTSDTEDECICDGVQDWTCPLHGYDGSDTEDVGEVSWTEILLEEIANNGPGEIYFSPERARAVLDRLRRTPETCEWRENEEGAWETTCGEMWEFIDDGPDENGMRFCYCCGSKLRAVYANAGGEDE